MDIKQNRNQTDRILPRNRWKTYLAVSQTPNPASSQLKQRHPTEVYDILCNGGFHFIPHFYQAYQVKSNTLGTLHNLLPISQPDG